MSLMTTVGLEFMARDRSRSGFASLNRNLMNLNRRFFSVGRTLLAVAGIGGFGYMIKSQLATIDSTAKLSDRLGMTTEALIAMQHGAGIAGVQQETLNKSLEIFSRRLGEVDMGVGQAKYALDKLGLSYTELIGKSPDEAIGIVADQINTLSTQAEKAAAANYLFGRSGQQLLNLFEQGSAGIEQFRLETERLGLSFSRIDAAKIEAANDSLTRTKAVFTGLFRSATIEIAPYIEAASNSFVDYATRGEGVGSNMVNVFESITLAIGTVVGETESLIITLGKLSSPLDYIKKVSEANKKAIEQYRAITGDVKAFTYPGGLLSLPVQPRDPYMWEIVSNVQKQAAGLEPVDRSGEIKSAFENIRKNAAERADLSMKMRDKEIVSAQQAGAAEVEIVRQTTEQQIKSANERAKITARMYNDMGQLGSGYFEVQKTLLDDQKAEYGKFIDDKVLLERWYSGELIKLQEETAEQSVNLWDRAMAEREKIWRNGLSRIAAAEREQMDIMMRQQDETKAKWVSMWDPVIDGSMTAKEAVSAFFRDFLIRLVQAKAQMMMLNLWNAGVGGIFGGVSGAVLGAGMGGALTGGGSMVTAGGSAAGGGNPYFLHSGWVPDGVPSFRTGRGLKQNEMAAIIEKDEMLVPAGQVVRSSGGFGRGGSAPNINIYNESGQQIEQKGPPEFNGEQWVVSLVAKNISEGGSLSKLMKG